MNIWNTVKRFGKKFKKFKLLPILSALFIIPVFSFSVFADELGATLINPYMQFVGYHQSERLSGQTYSFNSFINDGASESSRFYGNFINPSVFDMYDYEDYASEFLLFRSPLVISEIGSYKDESLNFTFSLDDGLETSQTEFQPTLVSVQIFGSIVENEVETSHTWVFTPTSFVSRYEDIESSSTGYYPPGTTEVFIFDYATFDFTITCPADSKYIFDTFEIAMRHDTAGVYSGQFTNTFDFYVNNFYCSYSGSNEDTAKIISAIDRANKELLDSLGTTPLPTPETDNFDNVLDLDGDALSLGIEAGNSLDLSAQQANGFLSVHDNFYRRSLAFISSCVNSFYSSGGFLSFILRTTIPIGLFATLVGIASAIKRKF